MSEIPEMIAIFLNYLECQRGLSEATIRAYTSDLCQTFSLYKQNIFDLRSRNHLNKSNLCLGKLDKNLLPLLKNAQHQWRDLSPATKNRKTATLKSFCKWLYQESYTESNLGEQLYASRVPEKLPKYLSLDEVLSLIRYAEKKNPLAKNYLLFLLLYGAGLRVSEACELKWENLNLAQKSLLILGKGQKERLIQIPIFLVQSLQAHLSKDIYVWGCHALNPRLAYQWIQDFGKEAGLLRPIHPHMLRHSYATHMLSSGSDLRILQELLGHSNLQATQKYTHLSLDDLGRKLEMHHPLSKRKNYE